MGDANSDRPTDPSVMDSSVGERLSLSERLASIGTLAAGVAHEINNPLAFILANLDYATQQLASAVVAIDSGRVNEASATLKEMGEALAEAHEGAHRVRRIVRDLRTFSRPDDERTGAVDVHVSIESALAMAQNELRHHARIVRDYNDVPLVLANEARLAQVFLNLLVNAAHAIPEGRANENEIRVVSRTLDANRVAIEISDTGMGIPHETIARIFEPFFTTKPVGEGTGLGLAICHGIVTALGGQIRVDSEIGRGTTFTVIIPVARGVGTTSSMPAPPRKPSGVRAKVLVVDDEPLVGKMVARILGKEHDVTVESSARDAITRVQKGERYDLLLCDVMMPDVTGAECYEMILEIAPEQAERVVLVTGGAFTERTREFLRVTNCPTLEKPFTRATLLALIDERLAQI